jgi:hypothetical protein
MLVRRPKAIDGRLLLSAVFSSAGRKNGINRVLKNKYQALSQGVRRFGKRSLCAYL